MWSFSLPLWMRRKLNSIELFFLNIQFTEPEFRHITTTTREQVKATAHLLQAVYKDMTNLNYAFTPQL